VAEGLLLTFIFYLIPYSNIVEKGQERGDERDGNR